ncbi:hypothetical protein DFH06DRAFT_908211, partial [Mycena polygramma]
NNHARAAHDLARKAAQNPRTPPASLPDSAEMEMEAGDAPVDAEDAKVSTLLAEESPPKSKSVHVRDEDLGPDHPSHRGRVKERQLQRENLETLLNVASNKEFWTLIRGWTDPKNRSARVSAQQLREVFETRLNPPEVIPDVFDLEEREHHQRLADVLPSRTVDVSPQRTFSRPFIIKDIEDAKLHIRKHNLKSA